MLSIIESKFTFFQGQIKGIFRDSFKFAKPGLCQSPKVFNSINMGVSIGEFIFPMLDSIMLTITKINQAIVGFKTICIDYRIFAHTLFYNRVKFFCRAVFNNLRSGTQSSRVAPSDFPDQCGGAGHWIDDEIPLKHGVHQMELLR